MQFLDCPIIIDSKIDEDPRLYQLFEPDMDCSNCGRCVLKVVNNLVNRINTLYVPIPMFEDRKPVHKGDKTDKGVVAYIDISTDEDNHGSYTLFDKKFNILYEGSHNDFVKRPTPIGFDKGGIATYIGDMVLDVETDLGPFEVVSVSSTHTSINFGGGLIISKPNNCFTHIDHLSKMENSDE